MKFARNSLRCKHGHSKPEGPHTLPMELGPQKTIPILVLGDLIP